MISVYTGENSFELSRKIKQISADFEGNVERFDGDQLQLNQLPDIFTGTSLFANSRLVIIERASENKQLWSEIAEWVPKISDDIHAVLIEPKPDKRTKTYKDLLKQAELIEFPAWSDRDYIKAEQWVVSEAKNLGAVMDKKSAQSLVNRVGVDQWSLYHAIEKLAVMDKITPEVIDRLIEKTPSENVFNLLDAALRKDTNRVNEMIRTLQLTDDPYMVFGLLSSQVMQLAALAVSDQPSSEVAKAIGAYPFALQKLTPHAKSLSRKEAKRIVGLFADTDFAMKSSGTEPWLQIERALLKI